MSLFPKDFAFSFLTIAGSDNSGGAGLQADIKTATVLGGYAASAVTAITVQDRFGVKKCQHVDAALVSEQILSVLTDRQIDVIKIGMLGCADIVKKVANILEDYPDITVILDPVLAASDGAALLDEDAIDILKKRLMPRAYVITPNLPELRILSGIKISSVKTALAAGQKLLEDGAQNLLLKGGHACITEEVTDILLTPEGSHKFSLPYLETQAGHGTGCTLASALGCYLAKGHALIDAVRMAKEYVYKTLQNAPVSGKGTDPLCHNFIML